MATASTPRVRRLSNKAKQSGTTFWCRLGKCTDGSKFPHSIAGTQDELNRYSFGPDEQVIELDFKPLNAARRFRVVDDAWTPGHPTTLDQQAWDKWEASIPNTPKPRHALDLLENFDASNEFFHTPGDLVTRDEGLRQVAEANQAVLDSGRVIAARWHMLVELGEPLAVPSGSVHLHANGVGVERRELEFPVRIVRPTAAEIACYAS